MKHKTDKIKLLAIWMVDGAIQIEGGWEMLRLIVRKAAEDAAYLYGSENEETAEESDGFGVRALLARFAHDLDENKRMRDEDKE